MTRDLLQFPANEVFPSIVNLVERLAADEPGRFYVRKTYGAQARKTGIALPLERAQIEQRLLVYATRTADELGPWLILPRCTAFDANVPVAVFEGIWGTPLRFAPPHNWPSAETFFNLGRFVASVEAALPDVISGIFLDLAETQAAVREALYKLKLQNVSAAVESQPLVLCLGDLSLANLIACGDKLAPIDFEFAHAGCAGYDLGQLLAELTVIRDLSEKETDHVTAKLNAIIHGYLSYGGQELAARTWSCRFLPYYQEKYLIGESTP